MSTPMYNQDRLLEMIMTEQYHQFEGSTTIVCRIATDSGFSVTGESSCVDPTKFSEEEGRRIALQNALRRLRTMDTYHRMAMRAARHARNAP
jgi:hypothetical protein